MDYFEIIGTFGLILIILGWGIQVMRSSKTGLVVPVELSILYAVGSFLLFLYSIYLEIVVFMVLNLAAASVGIISVVQYLRWKAKDSENKKVKEK